MTERDAFDREIAQRLEGATSRTGGDQLLRLQEVTGRGRRIRRRRRNVAVAAAALGVVAVPIVTIVAVDAAHGRGPAAVEPADTTRLLGTFTTRVAPTRSADASLMGSWTFTLHGDGSIDVTAPPRYHGVISGSDYKATGGTVRLNLFVQDRCSSAPVGRYRWHRDQRGLHFIVVSDACATRRVVVTSAVWRPGI